MALVARRDRPTLRHAGEALVHAPPSGHGDLRPSGTQEAVRAVALVARRDRPTLRHAESAHIHALPGGHGGLRGPQARRSGR